jgi:hypothetical protein
MAGPVHEDVALTICNLPDRQINPAGGDFPCRVLSIFPKVLPVIASVAKQSSFSLSVASWIASLRSQ